MKRILSALLFLMLLSGSTMLYAQKDYSNCFLTSKGTSIRCKDVTLSSYYVQNLKQNNVDFKSTYNESRIYKTSSVLFLLSSIGFTSGYLYTAKVKPEQDNKKLLVFAASTATLSLVCTLLAQAKTQKAVEIHNKSIQVGLNSSGITMQLRL